jgi:hypothetical protein
MTTNFFHPSFLFLFLDPGWVKIRIRDKHPGSAALLACARFWLAERLYCSCAEWRVYASDEMKSVFVCDWKNGMLTVSDFMRMIPLVSDKMKGAR